ncbi:DUF6130 family protein [Sphingomonas limnosediminicola]|uniref:DUF6130 family protein n=1 Tax=Sphingomonas limnosediminicola TaxID=940133 RepID=UPI0031E0F769
MAATAIASDVSAQSARGVIGATPLVALDHEPAPRLVVDPPLPQPLSEGRVFIQYRTENLRVLPVFGAGALGVSPRIGHLHVTVDDAPWHFVDASGGTIVLVGLGEGPHNVLIELADPTHRVIAAQALHFVVPVQSKHQTPPPGGR